MQRIILKQLKASVHRLEGPEAPSLASYYRAYKREFRNYQKISNKKELLVAVRQADIVFGGDFHPFAQSQRTHLRILRELVKNKRPVVLALEAIDSRHQIFIQKYLQGKIDDKTFLKKINYFGSWGFPWENYKILFDLAKKHGLEVYGINQTMHDRKKKDLLLRDSHSASQIAQLRKLHGKSLIYVIYGDLHLASRHLPRLTKSILGKADQSRFVTVFQNSETLYWKLAQKNLEEKVDVLKLRTDAYCVVNSPPWLKWQAYLNFLENSIDRDVNDIRDKIDYSEPLTNIIEMIRQLLKLNGKFFDFNVYPKGDARLAAHLSKHLSKSELMWVERLIKQEKNFFIANPPTFYFPNFGVNHAASLAGKYIHAKVRGEKRSHYKFPKDFVPSIWIEAIGFFSSKVMNNRRKFNMMSDLPTHHRVTLLVLDQKLREQISYKTGDMLKLGTKRRGWKSMDYAEASQILGAHLGNKIYSSFHSGVLNIVELQRWLRLPVAYTPRFLKSYMAIVNSLRSVPDKQRSKNERL